MSDKKEIFLALAGNPNSGKTTLFNALTGANQHVGNYPGVTVERREGETRHRKTNLFITDLPGIYSLTAYSPDERIARHVLLKERPDVVVDVIDTGNLARNLYLAVQLIEMKQPLVLAFNMMDEVKKRGIKIDLPGLSALLGVPIVPTVGARQEGIQELLETAVEVGQTGRRPAVELKYAAEIEKAITQIQENLAGLDLGDGEPRWTAAKLLEGDREVEDWVRSAGGEKALLRTHEMKERLRSLMGDDPEILIADARYGWIQGALSETVSGGKAAGRDWSEKMDSVLVHRWLGFPFFLLIMFLTFEITFRLGRPLSDFLQLFFHWLGQSAAGFLPGGLVESLVVDGVIAGVGGVLVFIPNIMLLFMMVALMEDSGYMARAAFLVDRVMHLVGLHGKSFIPLFLGFGCNVPAIMGARVLENERDRRVTILITPFISCSARLPVYVLMAGTFFPAAAVGRVIFSLYILGILVAMIMAKLLRTLVVKGPPVPFVMELPPYRWPTWRGVLWHMGERTWMYLRKAGTIILALSLMVWFFSNFPRQVSYSPEISRAVGKAGSAAGLTGELKSAVDRERLARSYAGQLGRLLAPALAPIGLGEWKVGIALLTGFAAKEVVVSTLGTLYSLGENGPDLPSALRQDGFFFPLRAYTFLVFVLLYVPCLATLTVAWRELNSWKWMAAMVAMNVGVAYVVAGMVWWFGRLAGLG